MSPATSSGRLWSWHLSDHHSNTQQSRLIPNSNTEPTIIPRPLQSADLRKIIPLWKVCFVDALTVPRIVAVALVEIVSLKNVVTRFCFKLFLLLPLLLMSLPRPLLLLSNIFFPLFSISVSDFISCPGFRLPGHAFAVSTYVCQTGITAHRPPAKSPTGRKANIRFAR